VTAGGPVLSSGLFNSDSRTAIAGVVLIYAGNFGRRRCGLDGSDPGLASLVANATKISRLEVVWGELITEVSIQA